MPKWSPDGRGLVYGIGLFGFLAVLPFRAIPTFAIGGGVAVLTAYLIVLYGAAKVGTLAAVGEPRVIDIAYGTFVYSFLALPFLAEITANKYPLASSYAYTPGMIATAEIIIILGIAGYEVARVLQRRRISPAATAKRWQVSRRRAYLLAYIGLLFVLLAVARDGLGTFFTSHAARTEAFLGPSAGGGLKFYLNQNKASGGLLEILTQVPIFIGTYFLLRERHQNRNDPTLTRPHFAWLILPIIGNIIVNNPISNARFWFGTVLIGFASIYLPLHRRGGARLFLVLYLLISLFSFQQLAAFRTDQTNFTGQSLQQNLLTGVDYASGQQVLNAVGWVEQNGQQFGQRLEAAVLVEIPRSFWPGKPGDTGQLIGAAAGFKVSAPVWTDGYIDFGLFGVVVYLAVVGFAASAFDRRYGRSPPEQLFTGLAPIMSGLTVFVLRGSLVAAMANGIIPVVVISLCVAKRPKRQAAAATPNLVAAERVAIPAMPQSRRPTPVAATTHLAWRRVFGLDAPR